MDLIRTRSSGELREQSGGTAVLTRKRVDLNGAFLDRVWIGCQI